MRSCPVVDSGQARLARQAACAMARDLGFDEAQETAVALIVGELAANLVMHAGGGEIHLRTLRERGRVGLEVEARDHGPGFKDVQRCMRDGYSTGGTLGTGLGVVKQLADEFRVVSPPESGSIQTARLWRHAARRRPGRPDGRPRPPPGWRW